MSNYSKHKIMKRTGIVPAALIEAVNSPTLSIVKKQQQSRLLTLQLQEIPLEVQLAQIEKTKLPPLKSGRQVQALREAWNKPKKNKGSMLCTELWSPSQLKEARMESDCQVDKAKATKIASEATKSSNEYIEALDNHFLQKHPEYAESKALMMKMAQLDHIEIPKFSLFEEISQYGSPSSQQSKLSAFRKRYSTDDGGSDEIALLSSAKGLRGFDFSSQVKPLLEKNDGSLSGDRVSPNNKLPKIRSQLIRLDNSSPCEMERRESGSYFQYFTPQRPNNKRRLRRPISKKVSRYVPLGFNSSAPKN